MKLPIFICLLVASTLLQGAIASAQIRGDERHHRGDRPDRYDGDRYNNHNPHGGGNPYRPRPDYRPAPYPGPHPHPHPGYPGPRPYPHPEPRPYPRPNPYPDYPRDNYREANVQFYGVTRRLGGEWLRVGFNYPAYIDYVTVDLYRAGIRIHEAYAVTASGRRIYLSNLTYGGFIYAGQKVSSEYISAGERITAIDIRAESMGDYADVSVGVVSRYEYPSVYPARF